EDGIRDYKVTGVQTCALPIWEAPALDIARKLIERGARVKAHDPVAMDRFRSENGDMDVVCCDTPEDVARGADALVLVTEWQQYRSEERRVGKECRALERREE